MGAMADFHKCSFLLSCSPRGHGGLLHLGGWDQNPPIGVEAKPGKDGLVKFINESHIDGSSKVLRECQWDQVEISNSRAEESKDGWQGQRSWVWLNQCGRKTTCINKGFGTSRRLSTYLSSTYHLSSIYLSNIYHLSTITHPSVDPITFCLFAHSRPTLTKNMEA